MTIGLPTAGDSHPAGIFSSGLFCDPQLRSGSPVGIVSAIFDREDIAMAKGRPKQDERNSAPATPANSSKNKGNGNGANLDFETQLCRIWSR